MIRKIRNDTKLFLLSGGYPVNKNEWHFFSQEEIKKVVSNQNELLTILLPLCDGTKSYEKILTQISTTFDKGCIIELIEDLFSSFILVEKERLYEGVISYFHAGNRFEKRITMEEADTIVAEPSLPPIRGHLTQMYELPQFTLGALVATRRTTYDFGVNPLTISQLIPLFWSMYGLQNDFDRRLSDETYTIPSGGRIYGLRIDIFIFKPSNGLGVGHWSTPIIESMI